MNQSTIYDWENISQEIRYIATDKSGRAYGYTNKPRAFKTYGKWTNANFLPEEEGGVIIDKKDNPFQGIWYESLEKREVVPHV
ncbi:hypothetical protein ACWPO0_19325 [Acinetobacter nosocomialis]|uniref:hypothetical protein n=1 Tax=Acinetobacter nosocomialis TaxID=106654 RepID=UPI00124C0CBD|nr:hypothetical protein [Acinetobacter nosocomialis]